MTDRYIEKLEAELEEAKQRISTLEADLGRLLATASKRIVELLGENTALKAIQLQQAVNEEAATATVSARSVWPGEAR